MSVTLFLSQMLQNPMLAVSSLLTLGVILVNGWTDAPNAIATCVSTRTIDVRKAIIMAVIFNFFVGYGNSGKHNTYKNNGDDGSKCCKENEQCKLVGGKGTCINMGIYFPRMRNFGIYNR